MDRKVYHNREVINSAQQRSAEMKTWPSPLEKRMKDFLDKYFIRYDQQRIFYIYAPDGFILRYYIADFYIPDKKIIIEVDGKFHDKHAQHDKKRTKEIQEHYPNVEVLRYKWKDLSNALLMEQLLYRIK